MKTRIALTLLMTAVTALLAACGGGDETLAPTGGGGTGTSSFTATCNTAAYVAGSVDLPTATELAAYAGTYNGDEGAYATDGSFTKSGTAALTIAADGRITYQGTAYSPDSVCIDKAAGPYGRLVYFLVGTTGHFDVADTVDATLGQAWGVSPADGVTIFTKGLK
jgi:hypothetical protein